MHEPHGGSVLTVRGAVKNYGRVAALAGVDLDVAPGEFVALLGPNGAGKTTLFQILTGLFVPDGGRIEVAGFDIHRDAVPALANIGIVFQQPTIDLGMSVRANLEFHARLHGMTGAARAVRIEAELARLGLTEQAANKVRTLSGGTRRRVELARALLHQPKILLMDEASAGLDPASRRDLLAHVLSLRDLGSIGVLWATHLVEEAERADRVIVLHKGKVLRVGTPAELVTATGRASLAEAFITLTANDASGHINEPNRP